MPTREEITKIVESVVAELSKKGAISEPGTCKEGEDLGLLDLRTWIEVKSPVDLEAMKKIKLSCPARIGIGRAGPRFTTRTLLRFRADHAAAKDAVTLDVKEEVIEKLGLLPLQSACIDREVFLTRPDAGRVLSPESMELIKTKAVKSPQFQLVVSDGLSSTAIEANAPTLVPELLKRLESAGVKVGTPVFVKYARMRIADEVAHAVDAEVTLILSGERPGLVTAESMSAYLIYRPTAETTEADYTAMSNIHRSGTPPLEAAAQLAELAIKSLKAKASGAKLAQS